MEQSRSLAVYFLIWYPAVKFKSPLEIQQNLEIFEAKNMVFTHLSL